MKIRLLIAIPILAAVAFLVGNLILVDTEGQLVFFRIERTLHRLAPLIGCLLAMSAFRFDDYMFKAWAFIGGCAFFLLARDYAIFYFGVGDVTNVTLVILANLSNVIGYFILAKAWRVAGLEFPGSETKKLMIMSLTIGAALAVAGTAAIYSFRDLMGGDVLAIRGVASSLADLVTFCMIAPLLMTALALRGGILVWPWALITVSRIGWLCLDMSQFAGKGIGLSDNMIGIGGDIFRSLGAFFTCSAGIAQWWVVKVRTQNLNIPSKATDRDGPNP